jgi:dTDP-4-dehydrorhamnose reductase
LKILLLGKSGMLGSYFLKLLTGSNDFEVFAYDYDTLDITNPESLAKTFDEVRPFFVINCAAYTAVDDCEKNPELAFKVNGHAVGEIASQCKKYNSILIHFGTDYIFNGEKESGYKEDGEIPDPINVYGESKLLGESLIFKNTDKFYLVRTAWLYGPNGKNFVDTMLELAKTKTSLDVVDDQIGCPTYTKDLAEAVIHNFIESYVDGGKNVPFGVYHLTNSGHCSWNEFARKIFEIFGKSIVVNKVTSDKFPRPAKRPHYSILLNTKLPSTTSWQEGLKNYLSLKF